MGKVQTAARCVDLFYDNFYFGKDIRWCNGKQYVIINSILYATSATFLNEKNVEHVVDYGYNFKGNE